MFPGIYDFAWDAGHIIFLGIFYTVLMVVAATMAVAIRRAFRDFRQHRAEALRWHADFEDLPERWRRCRHELAGEVSKRACENGFDCRVCDEHPKFMERRSSRPLPLLEPRAAGFEVPTGRLYHRGHTWVRGEADGSLAIGLDDLGAHLLRTADEVTLPGIGAHVTANATAWMVRKGGAAIRVLSPVDGEVIATRGPDFVLKVRPSEGARLDHLLTAEEARPWMLREVERLQVALPMDGVGAALADGGVPVNDLAAAIPAERRDEVLGLMFLNA